MDTKEKELREQMGSLSEKMQGIVDVAEQDGNRDLTDEEVTQFDSFKKEFDDTKGKLDRHVALQEAKGFKESKATDVIEKEATAGDDRAPDWMRRTVRYFNALATKKDDPEKANEMLNALRKDVQGITPRQYSDEMKEASEVIKSSGLSSVKQHALKSALEIEERLQTTSTTDTPKTGFLLPKPFLAEVFVIVEQYSVVRRHFRTIPMTSKSLDLKNVATKVTAAWTDEGSNITASDLVLSEQQLEVNKLAGITSWTSELEEDQAIALLPIVQELFGEAISEKEDRAGLLGDGSSTYGGFTGLLNLSNAEEITFSGGDDAGSDLSETYLRQAKNALSEARQRGAAWIMHRSTQEHVAQLENTAGFRIFQENIQGGTPNMLLGFPIITSEVMPAITAVEGDDPFIVLGNYSRALIGMRRGITADISREAVLQDGAGDIVYNAYQGDGALLRITERVGFKVPTAYENAFAVIKTAVS